MRCLSGGRILMDGLFLWEIFPWSFPFSAAAVRLTWSAKNKQSGFTAGGQPTVKQAGAGIVETLRTAKKRKELTELLRSNGQQR